MFSISQLLSKEKHLCIKQKELFEIWNFMLKEFIYGALWLANPNTDW
jgi:hypothetical protein